MAINRRWIGALALLLGAGLLLGGLRVRNQAALAARLARYRAAGEPVTWAELDAWHRRLATNGPAGAALLDALASLRLAAEADLPIRGTSAVRTAIGTRALPWTAPQAAAAAAYAETNRAADQALRALLAEPGLRYPMTFGRGAVFPSGHFKNLRQGLEHSALMAAIAAEAGRSDEALARVAESVRLLRTLDTEPLLISQLVRVTGLAATVRALERVLSRAEPTEAALGRLQEDFLGLASPLPTARGLVGDRVYVLEHFALGRGEFLTEVETLVTQQTDVAEVALIWQLPPGVLARIYAAAGSWHADRDDLLAALDRMATAAVGSDAAVRAGHELALADARQAPALRLAMRLELPTFAEALARELRVRARVRCVVAGLAVERYRLAHGRLPESLDALVPSYLSAVPRDPADDAPLRYVRRERGFTVYGLGDDAVDNGGVERELRPAAAKGWDEAFTVER